MKKIKLVKSLYLALCITTLGSLGSNVVQAANDSKIYSDSDILAVVKTATDLGIKVTAKDSKEISTVQSDIKNAQRIVSDDYFKQITVLNGVIEKQKADNDKFDSDMKTWNDKYNNGNNSDDTVDPDSLVQELVLNTEPNAKITAKNLNTDKVDDKILTAADESRYLNLGNLTGSYELKSKDKNGVSGKIGEVTYTNLEHSSYKGKKIAKEVVTYSDLLDTNGLPSNVFNSGKPSIIAFKDPTRTVDYFNSHGITYIPTYYLDDGTKVDFSKGHAYMSAGSLNHNGVGDSEHRESAQALGDTKAIGLNGSGVSFHKDGILYADKLNSPNTPGTPDNWDTTDSKDRAYGAGIVEFKGADPVIKFFTERGSKGANQYVWASSSTNIPESIVPPKPEKIIEKAEYQLTKISIKLPQTGLNKATNSFLIGFVIVLIGFGSILYYEGFKKNRKQNNK